MVKEKVLSGRYKDCPIVYDHIRSTNGEDIYFNSFSVMNMAPADQSKIDYWSDKSIRVDGSTQSEAEKDRRLITIEWRNGETSLLQVNNKTFNKLMESMYGRAPDEKTTAAKPAKKKSSGGKAIAIAIVLIAAAAMLKFFVF